MSKKMLKDWLIPRPGHLHPGWEPSAQEPEVGREGPGHSLGSAMGQKMLCVSRIHLKRAQADCFDEILSSIWSQRVSEKDTILWGWVGGLLSCPPARRKSVGSEPLS